MSSQRNKVTLIVGELRVKNFSVYIYVGRKDPRINRHYIAALRHCGCTASGGTANGFTNG